MIKNNLIIVIAALIANIMPINLAYSQAGESAIPGGDKSESPYFIVKGADEDVDGMPLLSTSADVTISGVIADVTVRQIYKNEGKTPLEAIYVFPASTRAAVYAMTMTIGDRVLKAEIEKKAKAREMYEKAKSEGKSASLLEQHRPNVFQMNVANIMPGDRIIVEMKYTELLIPVNRIYEFVYPTVVGPRYTREDENDDDAFAAQPYKKEGQEPDYKFDINISLDAGMPLGEISCKTHDVRIDKEEMSAKISLKGGQEKSGNRDFILQYKLAGDKIQTGILVSPGQKENFFLMMLQPPARVESSDMPKREFIFIMDVSGSMNGYPIRVAKKMMVNLLNELRPGDKFNIILFAGDSRWLSDVSLEATPDNIDKALAFFSQKRGSGGTQLLPALQKALNFPTTDDYSRTFAIVTDGYIGIEQATFDLMRENLGEANMFTFGIGSSVNRYLLEGMARIGLGEPFVITKPENAAKEAERFMKYIESPVMTGIKVEYDGFLAYDIEPKSIPDVLADRPILIYGKYEGQATGSIIVSGLSGIRYHVNIPLNKFAVHTEGNALKYLWARNKISILDDYAGLTYADENEEETTELGLKYNLLTKFTSFVAVDYKKRNDGQLVTVKQPLPLPENVSDYAVGGSVGYQSASGGTGVAPLMPASGGASVGADLSGTYPKSPTTQKIVVNGTNVSKKWTGANVVKLFKNDTNMKAETNIEYEIFGEKLRFNMFGNGLKFHDKKIGDGKQAIAGSNVKITFEAYDTDGNKLTELSGADTLEFMIGNGEVINGLYEGVKGMKAGGVRYLVVLRKMDLGSKPKFKTKARPVEIIIKVELISVE